MEVERVEAGAEVAAFLFVPDEGLAVVADGREQCRELKRVVVNPFARVWGVP